MKKQNFSARAICFALSIVMLTLGAAQNFAQNNEILVQKPEAVTQSAHVLENATNAQDKDLYLVLQRRTFPHLRPDESLREFAEREIKAEIDNDSFSEVIADNRPALSFSVTTNGQRTDYLLVEYESHLQLDVMRSSKIRNSLVLKNEPETMLTDDNQTHKIGSEQHYEMNALAAQVVATCGGINSPGNPYPCLNGGNCTFWAWHKAKLVWNQELPPFSRNRYYPSGDARYWAGHAQRAGWMVSSVPGSRTISVSSRISSYGHVWFNEYLGWNELWGNEMHWGAWGVKDPVRRTFAESNQGYIYPIAKSWRPQVTATVSPSLWASSRPYYILFSGQNFTANTIVDVTTPNNSMVSLRGAQVINSGSSGLWVQAVLNARGWWKFRVVAQDGQRSDFVYLWVN